MTHQNQYGSKYIEALDFAVRESRVRFNKRVARADEQTQALTVAFPELDQRKTTIMGFLIQGTMQRHGLQPIDHLCADGATRPYSQQTQNGYTYIHLHVPVKQAKALQDFADNRLMNELKAAANPRIPDATGIAPLGATGMSGTFDDSSATRLIFSSLGSHDADLTVAEVPVTQVLPRMRISHSDPDRRVRARAETVISRRPTAPPQQKQSSQLWRWGKSLIKGALDLGERFVSHLREVRKKTPQPPAHATESPLRPAIIKEPEKKPKCRPTRPVQAQKKREPAVYYVVIDEPPECAAPPTSRIRDAVRARPSFGDASVPRTLPETTEDQARKRAERARRMDEIARGQGWPPPRKG